MDRLNAEHSFDSPRELLDELIHGEQMNWIYRGQANFEWALETALERAIRSGSRQDDPVNFELGIHRRFMARASTYLTSVPNEHDEFGWLTLMQHYGAPTRLLDWTRSPLIGLFFAYEEDDLPGTCGRALWGLQALSCRMAFPMNAPGVQGDPFGLKRHTSSQAGGPEVTTYPGFEWDSLADRALTFQRLRERADAFPYPVLPPVLDDRMAAQQSLFT